MVADVRSHALGAQPGTTVGAGRNRLAVYSAGRTVIALHRLLLARYLSAFSEPGLVTRPDPRLPAATHSFATDFNRTRGPWRRTGNGTAMHSDPATAVPWRMRPTVRDTGRVWTIALAICPPGAWPSG